MKTLIFGFFLLSTLTLSPRLMAQANNPQIQALEPREAIGGILMAGLVGGILGLSTLSFYDKPQDNIRNISIGAGIGMIAAAIYMTYDVAESSKPAARAALRNTNEGASVESRWALLPDYNPQTQQASARYVLQF